MRIISQVYVGDGKFMLQLGGLSTEAKPTDSFVANGSQFIEDDTDAVFTFSGSWALSKNGQMKDLPVVTATDNGKILKVDNGVWSIGIDSGSSLPSMTGKNGKVLGVTLDAQDHEQAEWVTPSGGGGAEKFVVTITDNAGVTSNKTVAEILAAKAAGKEVVAHVTSSAYLDQVVELPLAWSLASEQGSAVFFSVCAPRIDQTVTEMAYSVYCLAQTGQEEEWGSYGVELGKGVPSYSSSNNGQVLGVSSGSLAWVDSTAPLIVTLTADQSTGNLVGNKTYKEIYDAFAGGQAVLCKGVVGSTNVSASVVAANSTSGEEYDLSVCVNGSIATPEGTATDYLTLHLGN